MNKHTRLNRRIIISSSSITTILTFLFISLLVLTWACNGNDQTSTSSTQTDSTTVMGADSSAVNNNGSMQGNVSDADFIMKAAEINLEEIKLGQLAQEKGTAPHVKKLGKMMVDEHKKAMQELVALAKVKTMTVPTEAGAKTMETYNMLKAKTGKDFDKAYSEMMVTGHNEAISLFQHISTSATDAEIKAWALKMLPALRTHLQHSEMSQKEINEM